jgi:hypothetical protein
MNLLRKNLNQMKKVSKRESMVIELVQFVRGKTNEEKKKIAYAYFEKKEYEKKRKLN